MKEDLAVEEVLVEIAATGEVEPEVKIEEAETEEVLTEEITTKWVTKKEAARQEIS